MSKIEYNKQQINVIKPGDPIPRDWMLSISDYVDGVREQRKNAHLDPQSVDTPPRTPHINKNTKH